MNTTTLDLGEGYQALAVFPTASDGAAGVLAALALPPHQAVLLLLGAADSLDATLVPRLTQFFGRGITRAALDSGAVVLDGGTYAGVMALMGQGVASRGQHISLVGVAPAALVAPQSAGHEHATRAAPLAFCAGRRPQWGAWASRPGWPTAAIGVALGSYLGYRQTESTLTKYNRAATDLGSVRAW